VGAMALRVGAQSPADEILNASRNALGGGKLSEVKTLAVWGPDKHGAQTSVLSLSIDLSGKILKEQTSYSSGGEIQRAAIGDDGAIMSGGGMPGDNGGPALSATLTEGLNGYDYWARTGAGSNPLGKPEDASAAPRKHSFIANYVRYVLALTLAPPGNIPVTFTAAGTLDSPRGKVDAIDIKGPDGFQTQLYIESKTHLPVMMQYREGATDVQLWLKEYKQEEGILFPHVMTWIANGTLSEEFQIQHFKINPKLRAEKFRK